MPYLWTNNKVAVDRSELVPRFYSEKYYYKKLGKFKNVPFGIKYLKGAFKDGVQQIDFDTLKPEIQEALGDPRKADNALEFYFDFDAGAVEYYGKYKRPDGTYLTPEEQERYIINASVMKAVIKLEQVRIQERLRMRKSLKGISATLVNEVNDFQNTLKTKHDIENGHNLPSSEKRFKPLLKECKTDLYYPIIKDPLGNGKQNARKVDDNVEMILDGLFAKQLHKPTPTEVANSYEAFLNGYATVYNEDTGEMYEPKEFPKLSKATITNYLNKWENKIATHKERMANRQQYIGHYVPSRQMDLPVLSGSLISIDDRQPPFWYDKGKRAWFYIGADVASQAITTVVYGKSKEGLILDFYRQMVRNYAEWGLSLPYELECESSLNSSFRNSLLRPGAMFQEVRMEANNARAKYIERMFGSLRYEVEKKEFGWIGRPHAKNEANQTDPTKNKIIPYDQLINARMLDLEKWNNMPHPEKPEMSRWDYFKAHQNPDLKPINWEAILPVLGYKEESSCRTGYVKLQYRDRAIAENGKILTGESLIQKMRMIEGKNIEVYWLNDNNGGVLKAMAYLNGRLVCELMEMPRFNRAKAEQNGAEQKEAMALQSAYVATIQAFAKTQSAKIENIGIIDNTPKTVNSNFRFPNIKRFEVATEEPEVFEDDQEEDLVTVPAPSTSWKNSFLQ